MVGAIPVHLGAGVWGTLAVALFADPEILGTGGVLRRASWFLDDAPFWMLNADIVMDVSPAPFLRCYEAKHPLAVLWLTDKDGPRTVAMRNMIITSLRSERPRTAGTYTFCGLQLLSPEVLSHLPPQPFVSIVEAYEAAMKSGAHVHGICVPRSYWADIGTPESYLAAHAGTFSAHKRNQPGGRLVGSEALSRIRQLRKEGVSITGFASVDRAARINSGARLTNVVVLKDGVCGSAACAENAIIAAPPPRNRTVRRMLVRADQCADQHVTIALKHLAWPARRASLECLEPRGSQRTFTRLLHGDDTVMMIVYNPENRENLRHGPLTQFLTRAGWRVPALLRNASRENMLLVEDAGVRTLQQQIEHQKASVTEANYREIVEDLVHLQRPITSAAKRAGPALEPAFGPRLYADDHRVFRQLYLHDRLGWTGRNIDDSMRELKTVGTYLQRQKQVLVHRDFQSSNIIMQHGSPVYIDFQGMRYGPETYDLASLLYDPYADLSPRLRRKLVDHYVTLTGSPLEAFHEAFIMAAVHRLTQALGAFGRFGASAETTRFTKYILPALRYLKYVLRNLDKFGRFSTLVDSAIELEMEHESR